MTQGERFLENLQFLKELFPGQIRLTLDDYAGLEGIGRESAAVHLRMSGCPYHQEKKKGKMTVLITDYAEHLSKNINRYGDRLNWHGAQMRGTATTYNPRRRKS